MTPQVILAALTATVALSGSNAAAQVVETETPAETTSMAPTTLAPSTVSISVSSPTTTTITTSVSGPGNTTGIASNLTQTLSFQAPSTVSSFNGTLGSGTGTGTAAAGVGGFAGSSVGGSAAPSTGTSFGTGSGLGGVTQSGPVYIDIPGMTPGVTP